jgi:hypothetical protein
VLTGIAAALASIAGIVGGRLGVVIALIGATLTGLAVDRQLRMGGKADKATQKEQKVEVSAPAPTSDARQDIPMPMRRRIVGVFFLLLIATVALYVATSPPGAGMDPGGLGNPPPPSLHGFAASLLALFTFVAWIALITELLNWIEPPRRRRKNGGT